MRKMKLHKDRVAFEALISDVSQRTGIRSDIVEKDYYLTLLLWELAEKMLTRISGLKVVFVTAYAKELVELKGSPPVENILKPISEDKLRKLHRLTG